MTAIASPCPSPLSLRERALLGGPGTLADAELLALILGTGAEGQPVITVAEALLQSAGSASKLTTVSPHELARRRGVGPAKAARILAALELGQRALLGALDEQREPLGSIDAVVRWAQPRLAALEHEEVWLLCLDARNALKTAERVAQGGAHGCALTASDVLRPALRHGASAMVLVHNHPSGEAQPSPEDIRMTRALAAACDVVGLPLLDHVVVARRGASSMVELGVLQ